MSKNHFLILVAVLVTMSLGPRVAVGAPAKAAPDQKVNTSAEEQAAIKAAEAWLALTDGGKYAESHAQACAYFRKATPKARWIQGLGAVRAPLGKLVSRKVSSAKYATSLPGAPDGKYVVIQFKTQFAKKASAVETVTPMKDPDGKWRVGGYYIR